MPRFRKKPVVIEAVRWTGSNGSDVAAFLRVFADWRADGDRILIDTLEGTMAADPGDWIIKGVAGEFYPCKNEIFEATYETVS